MSEVLCSLDPITKCNFSDYDLLHDLMGKDEMGMKAPIFRSLDYCKRFFSTSPSSLWFTSIYYRDDNHLIQYTRLHWLVVCRTLYTFPQTGPITYIMSAGGCGAHWHYAFHHYLFARGSRTPILTRRNVSAKENHSGWANKDNTETEERSSISVRSRVSLLTEQKYKSYRQAATPPPLLRLQYHFLWERKQPRFSRSYCSHTTKRV